MIEIRKEISEIGTQDIELKIEEDVILKIIFAPDGDVYWGFDNFNRVYEEKDSMYERIKITKDDINIYNIFNELYEDLVNCNIYLPEKTFFSSYEEEVEKCRRDNEFEKQSRAYNKLVQDNVITWYDDEERVEIADCVRISREDEIIVIEFIRQSEVNYMNYPREVGYYSIRFRTSGSRYTPCDIVFWRHYDKLQKYEPVNKKEDIKVRKLKIDNQ